MTVVVVAPKVAEMLSKMPSAGRAFTVNVTVVSFVSPSSSMAVMVTVHVPAGRSSMIQVGPVKSVSPMVLPSPSKSRWLLSHW